MSLIKLNKALLTPAQVHIDGPLSNISIAYLQTSTFVADKVFPVVSVTKQTDRYYIYNRGDFNRIGNIQPRAPRTKAPTIGMGISTDSYSADVFSLAFDLDNQTMANADAVLQIRQAQTEMLTMQLTIDKEIKWANAFFRAGVWGAEFAGVTGVPGANQFRQWSDYTNSTPINDVTTAMRLTQLKSGGFKPNTMVVGKEVRDILINHPTILNRLNGGATVSDTALITDAKLAEIFGVSRFLVMDAVQNIAVEGLAENNTFIGGKLALLCYVPPTSGLMVPSAGYTFAWDSLEGASGFGISVKSYTGDFLAVEGIVEKVEVNMAYDHKVIGADLGFFFNTIVA